MRLGIFCGCGNPREGELSGPCARPQHRLPCQITGPTMCADDVSSCGQRLSGETPLAQGEGHGVHRLNDGSTALPEPGDSRPPLVGGLLVLARRRRRDGSARRRGRRSCRGNCRCCGRRGNSKGVTKHRALVWSRRTGARRRSEPSGSGPSLAARPLGGGIRRSPPDPEAPPVWQDTLDHFPARLHNRIPHFAKETCDGPD